MLARMKTPHLAKCVAFDSSPFNDDDSRVIVYQARGRRVRAIVRPEKWVGLIYQYDTRHDLHRMSSGPSWARVILSVLHVCAHGGKATKLRSTCGAWRVVGRIPHGWRGMA